MDVKFNQCSKSAAGQTLQRHNICPPRRLGKEELNCPPFSHERKFLVKWDSLCCGFSNLLWKFLCCVVFFWHPGPEKSRLPATAGLRIPLFALEVVWWVCCYWGDKLSDKKMNQDRKEAKLSTLLSKKYSNMTIRNNHSIKVLNLRLSLICWIVTDYVTSSVVALRENTVFKCWINSY